MDDEIRARVDALQQQLLACNLCLHGCGVNRRAGQLGVCRTGDGIPVAHTGLHYGEEPPISGTRGSGTIFIANCNLRCVYCQNYQISQCADQLLVRHLTAQELADEMLALQARGAHNVNLVSPTHVAAGVAEALWLARRQGLAVPVVYNSNGSERVETLQAIEGLVDIYLPDIKYSDDGPAQAYSAAPDYVAVNRAAIAEMFRQVGNLSVNRRGIARRGLLVRHLVLPGDLAGSRASLTFLASLSTELVVSLMAQYAPHYRAPGMPPLNRPITPAEYEAVIQIALELGLENCFVQEYDSRNLLVPDFREPEPFC